MSADLVNVRSWQILRQYQDCVSFHYHNFVRHLFPSLMNNLVAFDLILCHNTMIYFGTNLDRRIISYFHNTLVDGG